MKKITLLIALMLTSLGFAQVPTSNPTTPPVRNATDVISIYGGDDNVYTNITPVNYVPYWGQPAGYIVPDPAFDVSGNKVLKYSNFTYQGMEWNAQNISGMEYLHIDIWTNSQAPNIFVISSGAEIAKPIASVAGSWQSIDIPVAGITIDLTNARQFKFDGGSGGEIYIDNLYFWKSPPNPLKDATLSDLKVDGTTISGFNSSALSYNIDLVVGTTIVPQITDATTTNVGATRLITQATAIPGSATVLVTSADASTTSTYTINYKANIPIAAPTPSTPDSEVFSIYGDTGGFTNVWVPAYSFGSFAGKPDLNPTAAVNEAIKMNFASEGYGEGLLDTAPRKDVSAYGYLNFSYYVESGAANAGSSGHQFYFDLIHKVGTAGNVETFYGIGTALTSAGQPFEQVKKLIVFDSWQTVSIPLSDFVGFSPANLLQFKIGASSDLRTKIAYFDNIYFSVNPGTLLGTKKFETSNIKMYPNPVKNFLNIEANSSIDNVTVYNILGQEVMKVSPKSNSATLQTADLQKGIYMITTDIDGKISASKFLKE